MNQCLEELSAIQESKEEDIYTLDEEGGFEEMLNYLQLFDDQYLTIDEVQDEIIEHMHQADNSLTAKLKRIKEYVERVESAAMGQFLLAKYKNLVRCFLFYQSAMVEDYSLMFDILQATGKFSKNLNTFLKQLETVTARLKQQQKNNLTHCYLEIVYILIRIKLCSKDMKVVQIRKLKKYCLEDRLNVLAEFAVKIIIKNHVESMSHFQFLREMIGYNKYDRLLPKKQTQNHLTIAIKEQQEKLEQIQHLSKQKLSKQSLEVQNLKLIQKSTSQDSTKKQVVIQPTLKGPIFTLLSAIDWLKEKKQRNKEAQHAIKSISIKDIKMMPNGKQIMLKILEISFTHLELLADSIEKALYLFQIQEFIIQMKSLFQQKQLNKHAEAKKIVKKMLRQYCGNDASHFWAKIDCDHGK